MNTPRSLFSYRSTNPYHLSVGAVMLNDAGLVACHHFAEYEGRQDFYILMRESVEQDESLLDAVHRGLREEFGATAQIERYLGSIVSQFTIDGEPRGEKTTLYVLARQVGDLGERQTGDSEEASIIEFMPPQELAAKMRAQAKRFTDRTDLDESAILERI